MDTRDKEVLNMQFTLIPILVKARENGLKFPRKRAGIGFLCFYTDKYCYAIQK